MYIAILVLSELPKKFISMKNKSYITLKEVFFLS